MIRRGARPPSPLHHGRPGHYVLTNDTTAAANTGAAVGFTSVPPGTPNPTNQQTAGQIIGSLPRANAIQAGPGLSGVTRLFPIAQLPPYYGYIDFHLFWANTAADLFPSSQNFVMTNGRAQPIPSDQTAMRALFDTLTQLNEPAQFTAPPTHTQDFPGTEALLQLGSPSGNGLRVWLPPGQNDAWVFFNFFDPAEAALLWWTAVAAPATEAAIPPSS